MKSPRRWRGDFCIPYLMKRLVQNISLQSHPHIKQHQDSGDSQNRTGHHEKYAKALAEIKLLAIEKAKSPQ